MILLLPTSTLFPYTTLFRSGLVSVRPGHHDVFRVTFVQPVPFLVTKDVEVQGVEDLEVLLDRWRLLLVRRRRRRGVLRRRLPEGDGGESGGCEAGQEIAINRFHEWFLSRDVSVP